MFLVPSFNQLFEAFSFCSPPYSTCWLCMSNHLLPSIPLTDDLGSCLCFSTLQHFPRFLSHLPGLCAMIRACNYVMPLSELFKSLVLSPWWSYGSAHTSSSLSSSIGRHRPSLLPLKLDMLCDVL